MNRHLPHYLVFFLGLAVVLWIAAGYVGTSPLALAVTLLIGALYVVGARELLRQRRATATLETASAALSAGPVDYAEWLARIDPSVRNAVRLRVEGERTPLPPPALTPYLVGLLVLLGMLGTLLGMMVTLRGTGIALETATDLQAIRDSLSAPVKGLGFAFGTSIAGIATSAMLGLLSALCKRDRLDAVQALDAAAATGLRQHSQAYQREQVLALLQQQTGLLPALVERMQAMTQAVEQHNREAQERQLANQEAFHATATGTYAQLADAARQAIERNATDCAHMVGTALRPVVENAMQALARDNSALHETVTRAVDAQLQGLTSGFETSTARVAALWQQALEAQQQANASLKTELGGTLARFSDGFAQQAGQLVDRVAERLDTTTGHISEAWQQALTQQQAAAEATASRNGEALATAAASFGQHATALLQSVDRSHAELQAALATQDAERLQTWAATLGTMTDALREHWDNAGAQVAAQHQQVCQTLAQTANDITAQAQAHASDTVSEISRLVQTASEAPRAAAEVVAELRQKLSDSMVRDTAMLEERTQLMATLQTLLDAVNHASTEQRTAIDALVATSADLLDRVGTRFTDHVAAETGKLAGAAAQVSVGAAEVASMGEAFAAAVQLFGDSNAKLLERLQGIEGALDKSLARSDEQLAYYVAQAREVIDLSLLTQRQVIEDLERLQASRDAIETA